MAQVDAADGNDQAKNKQNYLLALRLQKFIGIFIKLESGSPSVDSY